MMLRLRSIYLLLIVLSAASGYANTAKVTADNNAGLSKMVLSKGTLSPQFNATTFSYSASVEPEITSVTLTPTVSTAGATVKVNGVLVPSGTASAAIPLATGVNTITAVVTSQDSASTSTYTISVTRIAPNALLKTLSVSGDPVSPALSPGTYSYTAVGFSKETTFVHITATAQLNATISVNGNVITPGNVSQDIPVTNDTLNAITIVVTSSDGLLTQTYTVHVRVNKSKDTYLSSLSCNGVPIKGFNPVYYSFSVPIANNITSAIITPTAQEAVQTLYVNGVVVASGTPSAPIALNVGNNSIKVTVKSQYNTTRTYTVTVTRAPNTWAKLLNFTLSNGTLNPSFKDTIYRYTASVIGSTVVVTPTVPDSSATIKVNGTPVTSGTGAVVPLSAGTNTITILVTAQDGATTSTYTVTVTDRIALTITANNQLSIQGTPLPALTLTYSGFIDGDSTSNLTTLPTATTTATSASGQGCYPITVSGGSSGKYSFTYVPGTLTMVTQSFLQAPLTKTYGNADFYTFGAATTGVTYSSNNTSVATVSATGVVHITGAGNTTITFGKGSGNLTKSLTVNKAPLTITADNHFGIQGTALPALTLTYSGFLNGDTQAGFTTQPVVSTTAISSSSQGYYPITVSGGASANYTFTYAPGTLTMVTQAFLQAPVTKTYGDADFYTFGVATSGVTYSSNNTGVATVSLTGSVHIAGPGTATITFGTSNGNLNKTLTVNPAVLTVTANDQTKKAGEANPQFTLKYSGFVNGETHLDLTTRPKASTTATTSSPAGSYPITVTGGTSSNYTLVYVAGTLTITASGSHSLQTDNITAPQVRSALSPNGDGINDVLVIDGIQNFPDNKLTLINRSGAKVFETAGYDNVHRVFDGRLGINGKRQPAGTYFYLLQYRDNGVTKSKSGYFVIKN